MRIHVLLSPGHGLGQARQVDLSHALLDIVHFVTGNAGRVSSSGVRGVHSSHSAPFVASEIRMRDSETVCQRTLPQDEENGSRDRLSISGECECPYGTRG